MTAWEVFMSSYAMTMVNNDVNTRIRTDRRLFFFMDAILLPIITLGIWSLVVIYRMMHRRDEHFRREAALYRDLSEAIKGHIRDHGVDPNTLPETAGLDAAIRDKEEREQAKGAGLWLIISIITGGLGYIYVYYFLTVDFFHHEQREQEVLTKANLLLTSVGARPLILPQLELPERHYWLNILASFLTLGIWAIIWYYHMMSDPNRHFERQWVWEDGLIGQLSSVW